MLNVNDFPIQIGVDNQSTLSLVKNPVQHSRCKHIDIRYHFIRNEILEGTVNLYYVQTCDNIADIFTSPVTAQKLLLFESIRG